MNKKILAASLAAAVAASAVIAWRAFPAAAPAQTAPARKILYWYDPMAPDTHYDHAGKSPDMGMDLLPKYDETAAAKSRPARRIAYWTDPMQAGSHYAKPGKSPLMDMDLVPVYAQDSATALPGEVAIAPATLQHSAVRYAEVQSARLDDTLAVVGTVKIDDRRVVTVISKMGGWVSSMPIRAVSETVRAGTTIASIASPEARQMAAELALAQGDAALSRAARQRLATWGVAAGGQVSVTAPQSGAVTEVFTRPGARLEAGQPLLTLANLDRVWIVGELLENDSARVKSGDSVAVTFPAWPGQTLHGKVEAVLPQLNPDSRTLPLRVSVANPGGQLKPGMLAKLAFNSDSRPHLLVPSEAVIRTGRRTLVVLARENGQFAPVAVVAGREAGGRTEILSGLAAGQRIVASGQFLLDSESNLQHGLDTLDAAGSAGVKP
ncbi:efflux RND transporter periplasmic adaptor subunit [Paludibacterium yongneupense]|uniref:efflux RND transporter periplasmic adaptor subunit n=1 Tax=Paludibacterium yongneupense TaxID=400061 RepID=UPI0003F9512D|nr:efflux RND transporter periplasmic adaptor subunit [Paludibacterium yongneupense]